MPWSAIGISVRAWKIEVDRRSSRDVCLRDERWPTKAPVRPTAMPSDANANSISALVPDWGPRVYPERCGYSPLLWPGDVDITPHRERSAVMDAPIFARSARADIEPHRVYIHLHRTCINLIIVSGTIASRGTRAIVSIIGTGKSVSNSPAESIVRVQLLLRSTKDRRGHGHASVNISVNHKLTGPITRRHANRAIKYVE